MLTSPTYRPRRGFSVSSKISLGFTIVLVLHVSIAVLGHYGLSKSRHDLEAYNALHHQVETFDTIDRVVGELQRNVLLFAFSGYKGPELRAVQLHDDLDALLARASEHDLDIAYRNAIEDMKTHLVSHREIFDAVVVDRANRRRLVNDVLTQYVHDFDSSLKPRLQEPSYAPNYLAILSEAKADFWAASYHTNKFINAPDSAHVRDAKSHLLRSVTLLNSLEADSDASILAATEAIAGYEDALIQMVQATRGYLHLVNVVLAGESADFRRLASELRTKQSSHVEALAKSMAHDSQRFQTSSNIFSLLTIILGVAAAWLIGRDVAPPLNAIAHTFDNLTQGQACEKIPGLGRRDELGRLAKAAQIFMDKADATQRLLELAQFSERELNLLNQQLATQTALAKTKADEATAATLAKSEFLANMSHEIRTPMTAILGFSETIAEKVSDSDGLEAVETIRRNGEHLLAIINDILDLSKIEAGKMTVELIEFNPSSLIAEVISLSRIKADGAGLLLSAEFVGPIPKSIKTDPTRLRQILINLLGNAIKFTEVGSVRLVTSFIERDGQSLMQFDIVDSGIGMTQSQISGLFQPFCQADASTTRRFGGTGLGLTISKRFAQMLGGDLVLAESQKGLGSCFRVTLSTGSLENVEMDTAPSLAVEESPPVKQDHPSLVGLRVLLAEDGPDNQRLISFVLKKEGAEVQIAENGKIARDLAMEAMASDAAFNVILMDMQMPVMDGYQATKLLRDEGYVGPILALTAHAMDGDDKRCRDAGCDDYLTKPIHRISFIRKVCEWGTPEHVSATAEVQENGTPLAFTANLEDSDPHNALPTYPTFSN